MERKYLHSQESSLGFGGCACRPLFLSAARIVTYSKIFDFLGTRVIKSLLLARADPSFVFFQIHAKCPFCGATFSRLRQWVKHFDKCKKKWQGLNGRYSKASRVKRDLCHLASEHLDQQLEARAALELRTKKETQSEEGIQDQADPVAEDNGWEEDGGDSSGVLSVKIHVDFIGLSHQACSFHRISQCDVRQAAKTPTCMSLHGALTARRSLHFTGQRSHCSVLIACHCTAL